MSKSYIFRVEEASKYGLEQAVMLQALRFWIEYNYHNGVNYDSGHTWTYNSCEAWAELMPFWSAQKCRRILEKLISEGIIIKKKPRVGRGDHTCWYAFADEAKWLDLSGPPKARPAPPDAADLQAAATTQATSLPAGWKPPAASQKRALKACGGDAARLQKEFQSFTKKHSPGGQYEKVKRKNWARAFENWVAKGLQFTPPKQGGELPLSPEAAWGLKEIPPRPLRRGVDQLTCHCAGVSGLSRKYVAKVLKLIFLLHREGYRFALIIIDPQIAVARHINNRPLVYCAFQQYTLAVVVCVFFQLPFVPCPVVCPPCVHNLIIGEIHALAVFCVAHQHIGCAIPRIFHNHMMPIAHFGDSHIFILGYAPYGVF